MNYWRLVAYRVFVILLAVYTLGLIGHLLGDGPR